jgi:hypothetical protein
MFWHILFEVVIPIAISILVFSGTILIIKLTIDEL